jgi:hypothetical protein
MKKLIIVINLLILSGFIFAQELPKDVQRVYKGAEHLKSKKKLSEAVAAYKEVLRSVDHVPSMISIADIEMNMRKPPNYSVAYKYYDMAINELDKQIASTSKKRVKASLAKQIDELIPKRKKAKSHVSDFDKLREQKKHGQQMLEEEGLN